MQRLLRIFVYLLATFMFFAVVGVTGGVVALWHYGRGLPEFEQLADYEPPTVTRIHAGDGRLIAEYANERRVFVPIEAMPKTVISAFVAAEDQNFYSHPGVDFLALARAAFTNVVNFGSNKRPVGASTITQQVAKNFLLTNEVSIDRKIKEAILAFRIERAFPKDRILELYLNEIYLGYGSYGAAAAALNYFDKSLDELTVAEAAYLAALPKAPNNYHPVRYREAAVSRRNWVLGRMFEEGFIDLDTARTARRAPIEVKQTHAVQLVAADHFVEQVRRELVGRYGENGVNEGGLSVRTTLDTRFQKLAEHVLRQGLIDYDRRYGWRGPVAEISIADNWLGRLNSLKRPIGAREWRLAVVLRVDADAAELGFTDGSRGSIPLSELKWAREFVDWGRQGSAVKRADQVLKPGHVVLAEPVEVNESAEKDAPKEYPPDTYALRQIPEVDGGLVAMDPHTGRVLAMVGGFDYELSNFNRAVQAYRQPGSAFKPFVYLTALENGFTPATMILDAPFVIDQGPGLGKWKPDNYTRKFYGQAPMRIGIEQSRNLMTVRLARAVGMPAIVEQAKRFNVVDNMPEQLSMALGSGETSLLRLTTAYAMLVNGGKRIAPSVIDRVQNRHGKTVFRHDNRPCRGCVSAGWKGEPPPAIPDDREQIADPASAYQVVSMLEGVVKRGTGRRISELGRPLAGKTGTTNDSNDTWFVGFTPDLAVGVFVGFDNPKSLGRRETGSSVAAPIFKAFMAEALDGKPAIPFRVPPAVRLVRVDPATGRPAGPTDRHAILEAFKSGTDAGVAGARTLIDGDTDTADGSVSVGIAPISAGDLY